MIVLLFISFASAITFTSNTMKQDKFERKKGAVLSVNMYNGSDTIINQTFFGVEVDRFSQLQLGGGILIIKIQISRNMHLFLLFFYSIPKN